MLLRADSQWQIDLLHRVAAADSGVELKSPARRRGLKDYICITACLQKDSLWELWHVIPSRLLQVLEQQVRLHKESNADRIVNSYERKYLP